jgi:hypothetical protein
VIVVREVLQEPHTSFVFIIVLISWVCTGQLLQY